MYASRPGFLSSNRVSQYNAAMQRREFLVTSFVAAKLAAVQSAPAAPQRKGRLKQSVMSSVFPQGFTMPFEQRCKLLASIGYQGYDLASAQQVPILRDNGLTPALMTGSGTSFQDGLIRKELHSRFEEEFHKGIDLCAQVGCPSLIALPGERRGMPYEEAADNAVAIFSRVKGYAEQKNVTLCMEITNAKVAADQRTDQVFNRLAWGLDVCRRVKSPRVKIVFDIYHVQISDGDVVRNIRDNYDLICHFHTAGVPSRMEIDDSQELNYRFIAKAIADLGYTGFIAHEYRPGPGRDPVESLKQAYEILTV
jgi:hydroxypyruvate isomerase